MAQPGVDSPLLSQKRTVQWSFLCCPQSPAACPVSLGVRNARAVRWALVCWTLSLFRESSGELSFFILDPDKGTPQRATFIRAAHPPLSHHSPPLQRCVLAKTGSPFLCIYCIYLLLCADYYQVVHLAGNSWRGWRMLGGGVDAPTQRVPAEGSQRAGEDLGEDAFAAGHLHL